MNNKKIQDYILIFLFPVIIAWLFSDFCMTYMPQSVKTPVKLVSFMIVFLVLNTLMSNWRKEEGLFHKQEKPWYVVVQSFSESEKQELKQLRAQGKSLEAIKKVRIKSGASLLEAKQYVDSL